MSYEDVLQGSGADPSAAPPAPPKAGDEFEVTDGARDGAGTQEMADAPPPNPFADIVVITEDRAYEILEEYDRRIDPDLTYEQMETLVAEHAPPELKPVFAKLFGSRADREMDDRAAGLMFWECTEDHHGPVRAKSGRRQQSRTRGNQLFSEVMREWYKGVIYPFSSYRQLPLLLDPVYHRNEDGSIRYVKDPMNPNPRAPLIRDAILTTDPITGRQTTLHTVRMVAGLPVIDRFVRASVSHDRVTAWLAGQPNSGIENPVSGVMIDGNYLEKVIEPDERDMETVFKDMAVQQVR